MIRSKALLFVVCLLAGMLAPRFVQAALVQVNGTASFPSTRPVTIVFDYDPTAPDRGNNPDFGDFSLAGFLRVQAGALSFFEPLVIAALYVAGDGFGLQLVATRITDDIPADAAAGQRSSLLTFEFDALSSVRSLPSIEELGMANAISLNIIDEYLQGGFLTSGQRLIADLDPSSVTLVPLPGALSLFAGSVIGLALLRRRSNGGVPGPR